MNTSSGEPLDGVSATALWTLRSRAIESNRRRGLIDDPWAAHLFDAIAYDYDKFGRPAQYHVLRALRFDALTQEFLTRHPKASVVALAEGLQTSFWRLDSVGVVDNVTWYSVDLPPVIALRHRLLRPDDRVINLAISALDRQWMDRVDQSHPVLITAEGLLMYLAPNDALGLIRDCAQRFPAGQMIFDSITPGYSRRTLKGLRLSRRYTLPRMPFSLSTGQASELASTVPGVKSVRATSLPPGRGGYRLARLSGADRIGPLRTAGPTVLTFH